MNLAEVKAAPRREPGSRPKNSYEVSAPPIMGQLTLSREHPGATFELISASGLAGGSAFSFIRPHLDSAHRKAPQPRTIGITGLVLGVGIPVVLLVLGLISPVLALPLALLLGPASLFGGKRFMEWAFPPLELLPDEHTKTRWQKSLTAVTSVVGSIAAITGIVSFILVLGQ
jgi:hypothetical protein